MDPSLVSDLFNISLSGIISSLIFGIIGLWLFREGKRRLNHSILVIGIVMMMYPYFTKGPWGDWGVGVLLCALAYHFW